MVVGSDHLVQTKLNALLTSFACGSQSQSCPSFRRNLQIKANKANAKHFSSKKISYFLIFIAIQHFFTPNKRNKSPLQ